MARNRFDVSGKVVVVTGATKGLGHAFATALAEAGARVVVSSRKQELCDEVAAELRRAGGDAIGLACHMGDWEAIPGFVDRVYDAFGRVDVLVNNAAISPGLCPIVDMTSEYWDKVSSVNVKGPLRLSALLAPRMAAAGGGSIINISSIGAKHPHALNAHYDVSKAALLSLSQIMAIEWAPLRVRVNAVLPGAFRTEMMKAAERKDPSFVERARGATLMGRIGDPDECVGVVLYLASDASSFVTGAAHVVSGGIV
jgi:NAD(P)-dependent dehydrogenase (short-subunit alcohol dehydrogenase family)